MIDPENIQYVDTNNNNHIKIEILPDFETQEYDIYDEKDFKKFISDVEKDVRGSFEYQKAIRYIKENMDMNEDIFFESIRPNKESKVHIEAHHTPFTLYDIVITVINKRIFYNECMRLEQVSKEVAKLHYYMVVGLVGLSKTTHKLVHNQYLFVPTTKVLGRYDVFVQYYKEFMTPELLDTLDRIEEHTKIYNEKKNTKVLERNPITVETSLGLPNMQQLAIAMKEQVQTIKNNNYQLLSIDEQKQQLQLQDRSLPVYNNSDMQDGLIFLQDGLIFYDNTTPTIGDIRIT